MEYCFFIHMILCYYRLECFRFITFQTLIKLPHDVTKIL